MRERMVDITEILAEVRGGSDQALQDLIQITYPELRRLARRYMGQERPDHTLQPTALVHEAYLRLVGQKSIDYRDQAHFFAVAARVMRNLLIDHARARLGAKRRGGVTIQLDEALTFGGRDSGELRVLEDALERLATLDPRQSRVVELRYFGGLTMLKLHWSWVFPSGR